jgi:hypothetical protein
MPSRNDKPKKLLKLPVSDALHQHVWDFKHQRQMALNQAIVTMLEEHRLLGNVAERLANANDALAAARRRLGTPK